MSELRKQTAKALLITGLQINEPTLELIENISKHIEKNSDISLKDIDNLKLEIEAKYASQMEVKK